MYGSFIDDWKTPDEYISKEAAEKAIAAAMPSMSTPDGSGENDHLVLAAQEMCVDAIKAVRDVPSADVAPVVHGKWIEEKYQTTSAGRGRTINNKKIRCSVCGNGNGRNKKKFCPNCGAKMDGGTP